MKKLNLKNEKKCFLLFFFNSIFFLFSLILFFSNKQKENIQYIDGFEKIFYTLMIYIIQNYLNHKLNDMCRFH